MAANFDFLKKVDKNLYEIINEAEKLYRDEYFEQCMTQTRRFGEHVCKNTLGERRTIECTFDDMLATLKDKVTGEEQEKEFIEDLYFLKKHGNDSTHSAYVKKDGMEALECLQRAFEVAINYCVYVKNGASSLLDLHYDIELLVTGKPSKKALNEKYEEAKRGVNMGIESNTGAGRSGLKKTKFKSQSYSMKSKKDKDGKSVFWIFVGVSLTVSLLILIFMGLV